MSDDTDPAPDTEPAHPLAGPDTAPEDPAPAPLVVARGLTGRGPEGVAFGPVDLEIPAGGLHVLQGAPGSGRTSLLLAVAGRFSPVAGELEVAGHTSPARIREVCAIAGFADIDEIDDGVRLRAAVAEQLAWRTPWYRRAPRPEGAHLAALFDPVFGPLPQPDPAARFGDLSELDRMLVRIAMAVHDDPRLLIIDDLEQVRSRPDQEVLARRLTALGAERTVLATVINPLPAAIGPHLIYPEATVARATAPEKDH